jgi:hypothetical protein
MKTQNPSTSLGEGRDVAPSLAHPSQKQYLVVYTEDLTHLMGRDPLNVQLLERPSDLALLLLRSIPVMDGAGRDLK